MHVQSFVVCIVGKMAQDVVKVLSCHSHLVKLVFGGFHPYMLLLSFRNLFCELFLLFFCLFFVALLLGTLREKSGEREAKGKMHGL